jgi:hypothetical protein
MLSTGWTWCGVLSQASRIEVESCRADEWAQRRGLTSDLDEMWGFVGKKAEPWWLWHAIDHYSGTVLAYVFGCRQDTVFLELQDLLHPLELPGFTQRQGVQCGACEPTPPLPAPNLASMSLASHEPAWLAM